MKPEFRLIEKDVNRFLLGHIQHVPIRIGRLWAEEDYYRDILCHLSYGAETKMLPGRDTPYRYFRKSKLHTMFTWRVDYHDRQHGPLGDDLPTYLRYFLHNKKMFGWT